MKTSNAIATEIQALIDKSLAQKQETPNTSINLEGIDPKYHEQFS